MSLNFFFFSLNLVLLLQENFTWDLSNLKISSTYFVSSIAVYKNRAFLALPRSSCFNNISNPTLIEVPWPSDNKYGIFRKRIYPSYKQQSFGDCKDHQDVISLDVDQKKAKLWVLDKGNKKCSPKIVIYNLYYNTIGQSSRLWDVKGEVLSYILVDSFNGRAFVGGIDDIVLIFSSKTLKTTKIKLKSATDLIPTQYLAFSSVKPIIYLTSRKNVDLYSLDINVINNCDSDNCEIDVKKIGEKLGPSTGMVCDPYGRLYYYLTRDYAVVKWIENLPIIAENHEVVKQSYKELPYVSHFILESGNVFAVVNPAKNELCYKTNRVYKDLPKVETRVVKI